MLNSSMACSTWPYTFRLLLASPWGTVYTIPLGHWASTVWAYCSGTPESVRINTLRLATLANWYRLARHPLFRMIS